MRQGEGSAQPGEAAGADGHGDGVKPPPDQLGHHRCQGGLMTAPGRREALGKHRAVLCHGHRTPGERGVQGEDFHGGDLAR